jgi:hypothetical protein
MKRIVIASLFALALGGCLHEAALDQRLYGGMNNGLSGTKPAPLGKQAAVLVPPGEAAPPLRDPTVTATGVPVVAAGSAAPASAAAAAPETPRN